MARPVPVACDAEISARTYWIQTLSPFLVSLSSELALLQPSDPASLARAHCSSAAEWTGLCRPAGAHDAASAAAYMAAVGQPFCEALAAGVLQEGSLPADPAAAAAPLLAAGGALAASGAAAAASCGAGLVERTVQRLGEASSLLRAALAAAAEEGAQHGGGGVEREPEVARDALEAHIRSCQRG
jgi:hypothetical protein